jgi:proline iminopeptidase
MGIVDVNGAALLVEQVGDGPPALVLHGGMGLDHTMYRSLDPLAEHLRLVYYDHRGNGRSTGAAETMTMQQWAVDAAALARVVADQPVIVIGHSFGGFIAQEMAIEHGDAVAALILVTTTPGQLGAGEEPTPEGPPIPAEFAAMLADMPDTDDDYATMMRAIAPAYLHDAPVDEMRRLMSGVTYRADAMRRGFAELSTWTSVDRLSTVTAPVLVIAGRHDPFTAWPQADRIAAHLDDVELVVFENSAHFPWMEEPDAFFATVLGWLARRELIG